MHFPENYLKQVLKGIWDKNYNILIWHRIASYNFKYKTYLGMSKIQLIDIILLPDFWTPINRRWAKAKRCPSPGWWAQKPVPTLQI